MASVCDNESKYGVGFEPLQGETFMSEGLWVTTVPQSLVYTKECMLLYKPSTLENNRVFEMSVFWSFWNSFKAQMLFYGMSNAYAKLAHLDFINKKTIELFGFFKSNSTSPFMLFQLEDGPLCIVFSLSQKRSIRWILILMGNSSGLCKWCFVHCTKNDTEAFITI